jgi:protein FAM32A
MADAYSSIVGGKLNLKGGIEKKKKKRLKESSEAAELVATAAAAAAAVTAAASAASRSSGASSSSAIAAVSRSTGHTAAEMRHIQVKAQRTIEKIEKGEIKSHRDRVKDFNDYLGNLTEHYDLPKVRTAFTHLNDHFGNDIHAHHPIKLHSTGEQRELKRVLLHWAQAFCTSVLRTFPFVGIFCEKGLGTPRQAGRAYYHNQTIYIDTLRTYYVRIQLAVRIVRRVDNVDSRVVTCVIRARRSRPRSHRVNPTDGRSYSSGAEPD